MSDRERAELESILRDIARRMGVWCTTDLVRTEIESVANRLRFSNSADKQRLRDAFQQFSRNFRWGTCVDCPRVEGTAYPELCEHTARYDHQLGIESLVEQYRNHAKEKE